VLTLYVACVIFDRVGESGKEDVEEEAEKLATQAHITPQTPPPSHAVNQAFEHEGEKIALTDMSNGVNGVSNGETKMNGDANLSKYVGKGDNSCSRTSEKSTLQWWI
jgi:hypothetical protein